MRNVWWFITQWKNGSNELWTWSGQGLRTTSNAIYKRLKNISAVKLSTTTRLLLLLQNAANTQSIEYNLMVLFETLACQTYQKFVRFARGCWGWGAVSTIFDYGVRGRSHIHRAQCHWTDRLVHVQKLFVRHLHFDGEKKKSSFFWLFFL